MVVEEWLFNINIIILLNGLGKKMNTISIEQFLQDYVDEMSENGSSNLEGCITELVKNPRLQGPLIMYAAVVGYPKEIGYKFSWFYQEVLRVKYNYDHHFPMRKVYEKVLWSYDVELLQRKAIY